MLCWELCASKTTYHIDCKLTSCSLWETYTITSNVLEPNLNAHPTVIAAMSGAAAGGMQAVIAAPAENVRLVSES